MAASNYAKCLALVLKEEGGYVNNKRDPGGATNFGITQRVYTAWLRSRGLPNVPVLRITMDQVGAIYKPQYWDAIRGDDLPPGVDLCTLDLAVNSGPVKAIKFLQQSVGLTGKAVDGHIGAVTLGKVNDTAATTIIRADCALRLSFLKKLTIWKWFGKGWNARVGRIQAASLQMAGANS